jgi:hypothetical protein
MAPEHRLNGNLRHTPHLRVIFLPATTSAAANSNTGAGNCVTAHCAGSGKH